MPKSFGSDEFCKFLSGQGFSKHKSVGSSHLKYSAPKSIKVPQGIRPFITVILKRKTYDPHTISCYKRDLIRMGFPEKNLKDLF